MLYKYGMKLHSYAPGAQPQEGLEMALRVKVDNYKSILFYRRQLTEEEVQTYVLDPLGEVEDGQQYFEWGRCAR